MPSISRRDFLTRVAVGGTALALPQFLVSACSDVIGNPTESATLDLSTDPGVLNYFYAISQLQSDFWTRAQLNRFPGITTAESTAMVFLFTHTTNQRNWLQTYQTFGRVTDVLTFDFSNVDFTNRSTSFGTGIVIQDAASAAYAGGIKYLTSADNIVLASKLASIAARHSAMVRDFGDLFAGGSTRASFAGDDIIGPTGLEPAASPTDVIATLQKYFKTTLSVRGA
ncbi:MAG TPA: ferritin-like domain-containing protein [Gemmatimonadaceae bacterium]|jgi:hypothetical protein|nr:ferritin-like domain-containing protein [Gemmatimonadaceae bacterium]